MNWTLDEHLDLDVNLRQRTAVLLAGARGVEIVPRRARPRNGHRT